MMKKEEKYMKKRFAIVVMVMDNILANIVMVSREKNLEDMMVEI